MAKTQVEEAAAKAAEEDGLIPVTKDGQTIRVCTAQVEHHKSLGWSVAE